MTAHALQVASESFDPFLVRIRGAEVARDAAAIRRALAAVRHREVVVATDGGVVVVARVVDPLGLQFDGDVPVDAGERVSVSDQHGLEFIGFRALVGTVDRGIAYLFDPQEVVFHPGRQHPRLMGALGADVTLETDDGLLAARAVDVSLGGLGLLVASDAGLAPNRLLVAHLDFGDGTVSLPARVRSFTARDAWFRVGLQFVSWSDDLATRVQRALERPAEPEPFERVDDDEEEVGRTYF